MNSIIKIIRKENLIFRLFLFITLMLPVATSSLLLHPAGFSKAMLFRGLFVLIVAVIVYDILVAQKSFFFKSFLEKLKAKKSLLFYTPLALLVVLFVTTLLAVDVNFSFFGDPRRGGGFLTFALVVLWGYLAYFFFNKRDWRIVWVTLSLTAILSSLLAIIQWQGIFTDVIYEKGSRPFSFFGNPTILAGYLSVTFFVTLFHSLRENSRPWKVFYCLTSLLSLFVIVITYTRAAFLAVAVGVLFFVLFYPKKSKKVFLIKVATAISLLLIVLSVVYLNTTDELPQYIAENKQVSQLVSRFSASNALQDPRIGGFYIFFEAVKERPLTGYGVDGASYAFDKNYHPDMPFIGRDVAWWDKTHNIFLEFAIWGGVLAVSLLMLLLVLMFTTLQKKKKTNSEAHMVQAALLAFVVVSFFTIDDFTTYFLFTTLVGYTFYLNFKDKKIKEGELTIKRDKLSKIKIPLLIIFSVTSVIFIYQWSILPLLTNRNVNLATYYASAGRCGDAKELFDKAGEWNTPISSFVFYEQGLVLGDCFDDNIRSTREVFLGMDRSLKERPHYTRALINRGVASHRLVQYEQDKEYFLKTAVESLELAQYISPNRFSIKEELGMIYLKSKDIEGASRVATECLSLDKRSAKCNFIKGVSSEILGDDGKMFLQNAAERGLLVDDELTRIIVFHGYFSDFQAMIPYYRLLIRNNPEEAENYIFIAFAYNQTGDKESAKESLRKALQLGVQRTETVLSLIEDLL